MPNIHKTAIVSDNAVIADDVEIGPYSIVEADVEIGEGTWVGPHVVIRSHTHIGKHNKLYQYSSIGEAPQFIGYDNEPTKLYIGDHNVIREFCTLNRGTPDGVGKTTIGNHNFIMAYVHIAHDCTLGDRVIFANGASIAGHVEVGDYVVMGGFALIHQFCRIGAHCITGANSVCFQDVPPYIVAAGQVAKPYGINVKGLKRRDFSAEKIALLKSAYRLMFRKKLELDIAVKEIMQLEPGDPDLTAFCQFVESSKRGIIR